MIFFDGDAADLGDLAADGERAASSGWWAVA